MSSQDQTTQNQTVDGDIDESLATHSLLDTASAAGGFSNFLAAAASAGLDSLLSGPDLYTVFLPGNDAFPAGEAPSNVDLVRHHMTPGALTAEELTASGRVKTLHGDSLSIATKDDSIHIGAAAIVHPNIECTNGVLHIIDRLLVPPDFS